MKTQHVEETKSLEWKVNTAGLLSEIAQHNPSMAIMQKPLQIFANILYEVAKRASELNDPELNKLMARLALYAVSDPYSGEYDDKITDQLLSYKK